MDTTHAPPTTDRRVAPDSDDPTTRHVDPPHDKPAPYSPKTVQHVQQDGPVASTLPPPLPAPSPLALHTAADVRAHVPNLLGWPAADTELAPLSGGMSNSLYKLSHATLPAVVVRLFGQENVFSLTARHAENQLVRELAAARLAPALPAVFANGRVEQFLPASPIHVRDMSKPDVYRRIAQEMVRFHRFCPTERCGAVATRPAPGTLPAPLALVRRYRAQSARLHATGRLGTFDLSRATRALDNWLDRYARNGRCARGEGLVFAHNDLNPLNILRADDGSVSFIDFEFAGWNHKACEIALHFAETVAEHKRYELYPDAATLRDFCRVYLVEEHRGSPVDERVVDELVEDVALFDAFAHLLWGFWGLSRVRADADSDYDFLKFAEARFIAGYHLHSWL